MLTSPTTTHDYLGVRAPSSAVSWSSLLGEATIRGGRAGCVKVRIEFGSALPPARAYRLVVQSYPARAAVSLLAGRGGVPLGAALRPIGRVELARGIELSLLQAARSGEAVMVVAWIEPLAAEDDHLGLALKPPPDAAVASAVDGHPVVLQVELPVSNAA